MLAILGDLFPYAVPVALSPLPIIAAVMLLLAPAGTRSGLGLLAGRLAALAAVTLVFAALAGVVGGGGDERAGWLRVGLGLLLMAAALVVWRKGRAAADAQVPGWLRSVDRATPGTALRLGAMLTVVNVKELAFAAGAGAIISGAGLAAGQAVTAALVFAAVAGLGVAVPVLAVLLGGEAARVPLGKARDWLVLNQGIVMAAVLLVIGAMLVGSGIEALQPRY